MKTLVLLLVALPCAAKPVDAERLSKLFGFHRQSKVVTPEEPATPVPFRLLGTMRGENPLVALAAASRVVTATIGDIVFGSEILSIERTEITIRRDGRVERVTFASIVGAPSPSFAPRLTRGLISQQLANPMQLMTQVRMVPMFRDGKWAGFKTLSVQRDSMIEHLGLRSGDVITSVNGQPIDNPEKLLGLYQQLQVSRHFVVELERDGQRITQPLTIDE